VNGKKKFDIDIFGLQPGSHKYDFDIEDSFFQEFENSLIEKGSLKCRIILERTERLITAGKVELLCDRSLETFDHPVKIREQLIFKYGEEEEEMDNNIYTITSSTQRLKLGQPVFELISVSVPMRKLHPRFKDDDQENEDIYFSTSSETPGSDKKSENTDEENIDPRWEALKKLKDNIK